MTDIQSCGWTIYAIVVLVGSVLSAVVIIKDRSSDGHNGATTVSNAAAAWKAILSSALDLIAGYTAKLPITSKQETAGVARS